MTGRRPLPTQIRLVTGNPGRRPINLNEPKPRRETTPPPAHLSKTAKEAWFRFSELLNRMGVLTEADATALERMCETYAEIIELQEDLKRNGRFQEVTTKTGDVMERIRPAYSALMDADRRLKLWLVEFGKTPAARSKVKTDGSEAEENPADKYFA